MNTLFTQLAAAMQDRQEAILNIKKVGNDLVVMVTPDVNKKGTVKQMTGTPELMDAHFMEEFTKAPAAKVAFKADDVVTEQEEEEEDEKPKATSKKEVAKKAKKMLSESNKADAKKRKQEEAQRADKIKAAKAEEGNEEPAEEEKKEEAEVEEKPKEPTERERFNALMDEGKKLFDASQYSESATKFEEALKIFPDNAMAQKSLDNSNKWIKAMATL